MNSVRERILKVGGKVDPGVDFSGFTSAAKVHNGCGNFYIILTGKRGSREYLHRHVMSAGEGQFVDHANRDGLDNRRCNLRFCTKRQNNWNRSIQTNNKSGYKGVIWNKQCQKWQARIVLFGKQKHLGLFINPIDAASAYKAAARKHFKEFACA